MQCFEPRSLGDKGVPPPIYPIFPCLPVHALQGFIVGLSQQVGLDKPGVTVGQLTPSAHNE